MIRRRIIYVIVVAVVSSLIISGCVSAPPEATPMPTVTPAPATGIPTPVQTIPFQTAVPTIAVPAIKVTFSPASVNGEENFTIRWEVSGGTPGEISQTAAYWGYKSGRENISDYPRASDILTGKTPSQFSVNLKAPAGGDLIYFRAHAIVDSVNVYSQEYRITIIPRYTGAGGGY